ncbi:MAG: hypothetical protein E7259_07395 [Lachnospiraceae bacterium]|nr:hypothetical protein [Lachnospiraceae bacterium]
MNDYDKEYIIRLANKEDITEIMTFIDEYWKKGHIMAQNREFFEYEFLQSDGTVNFVLAFKKETMKLEGVLGFLYSSEKKEKRDVWGSIWKVREGNMPMLGVEILKKMEELSGARYDIGIGANPNTTIPIMKLYFKRVTDKMRQYYRLSHIKKDDFKIARIEEIPVVSSSTKVAEVFRIETIEEFKKVISPVLFDMQIPYKDYNYIDKHYYKHPIYNYKVWGIKKDIVDAFFVTREQEFEGKIAMRIIDYVGNQDMFSCTSNFWEKILKLPQYEYVDFYSYGFSDTSMKEAGFTCIKGNDTNIIPNYFQPYICKNIDIWIHTPYENVVIFKGDGDQDRPN